jgi:hypothetical protein
MTKKYFSVLSMLIIALLIVATLAVFARTSLGDITDEHDKNMAKAHESFVKGNIKKAAEYIHKAADYVKKDADKVAEDTKEEVKKAGDDLAKLGQGVKKGTVKSGDEVKKTFANVDYKLARAWYMTAEEAKKTGKDVSPALKKAGAGLEGAAKWSGTQLTDNAQASFEDIKKIRKSAGKCVKAGAEEVDKLFKGIREGIENLGRKLYGT